MRGTNVVELQNIILEHPAHIKKILEQLGHSCVRDRGEYYQCCNLDGDNKTAISIYKNTLKYVNYTRGADGNIFTLVQDEKKYSFPQALDYICNVIGIVNHSSRHIHKPFGGFYSNILKQQANPELFVKEYDESNLPSAGKLSKKFLDDNISLITQEEWGVRYSNEDDAILIPIYFNHKLVGCKARANTEIDYNHRWWAYLDYSKTCCVYGFDHNYTNIIQKGTIIITESEKGVLQLSSDGCNLGLGIGGCNISKTQAKYIKSLLVDKIIIAFDEGIQPEHMEFECKKLISNNKIYNNKVGYIFDGEHKYLPLGSKASPTDFGKDVFNKLVKECVTWL